MMALQDVPVIEINSTRPPLPDYAAHCRAVVRDGSNAAFGVRVSGPHLNRTIAFNGAAEGFLGRIRSITSKKSHVITAGEDRNARVLETFEVVERGEPVTINLSIQVPRTEVLSFTAFAGTDVHSRALAYGLCWPQTGSKQ